MYPTDLVWICTRHTFWLIRKTVLILISIVFVSVLMQYMVRQFLWYPNNVSGHAILYVVYVQVFDCDIESCRPYKIGQEPFHPVCSIVIALI